jgi:hypothetical protein
VVSEAGKTWHAVPAVSYAVTAQAVFDVLTGEADPNVAAETLRIRLDRTLFQEELPACFYTFLSFKE